MEALLFKARLKKRHVKNATISTPVPLYSLKLYKGAADGLQACRIVQNASQCVCALRKTLSRAHMRGQTRERPACIRFLPESGSRPPAARCPAASVAAHVPGRGWILACGVKLPAFVRHSVADLAQVRQWHDRTSSPLKALYFQGN